MIEQRTPRGLPVLVPENDDEDISRKFMMYEHAAIKAYYVQYGYVIVRGVFDSADCDAVRLLWNKEIKPYSGYIYRQATARAEVHQLNSRNWVMNPILNLQSVNPKAFPDFREFACSKVLTAPHLADAFRNILGEDPKIVQSMYFEGNSATWEHQDTYYLDSEEVGRMCAAWLALETIDAQAGRFFICPGSHRIDLKSHGLENNIAYNHEAYIQSVVEEIKSTGLEIRAPFLEKGDVLFWNAKTIHGSLATSSEINSRSSITCHAIPTSHDFLQLQTRRVSLKTQRINSVDIFCPKDQALLRNRVILWVESTFPKMFYYAKRQAIRWQVRRAKTAIVEMQHSYLNVESK